MGNYTQSRKYLRTFIGSPTCHSEPLRQAQGRLHEEPTLRRDPLFAQGNKDEQIFTALCTEKYVPNCQ
jgi:hypothetical protein